MKAVEITILLVGTAVVGLPLRTNAYLEEPYKIEWIRQFGTSADDGSYGVAADGLGNVYISGWTGGFLADAFVSKYGSGGELLWICQIGTSSSDASYGVTADGLGNVYISGETGGSLGGPNIGSTDAFVSKYNSIGDLLWTRQLGTSRWDESRGVAADGLGNVYISGVTKGSLSGPNAGGTDAFVSKYDSKGELLWTRQLGTSGWDESRGVVADGMGNVYISGFTEGSLCGPSAGDTDAFISKYNSKGELLWARQIGTTGSDGSDGIVADGLDNVYISGWTGGTLDGPNAGGYDAFASKYNSKGELLWTRQLGTISEDVSLGVATDDLGNVYISGFTGVLLADAFVSKYGSGGDLLWTCQLGTTLLEYSCGVAADRLGNVYISGYTYGSLGGPNAGGTDAFVAKLIIPEPATILLFGLGYMGICIVHRTRCNSHIG